MDTTKGLTVTHAVLMAATVLRAEVTQGESPLKYNHGYTVERLAFVDPSAPAHPEKSTYFAETQRKITRGPTGRPLKNPKFEPIPGAEPGVVAFVDFHVLPNTGHDGKENAIYIDYVAARDDQRGRGNAKVLLERLYKSYAKAAWIDWGSIHHDAMEKLFLRYRDLGDQGKVPLTRGKL